MPWRTEEGRACGWAALLVVATLLLGGCSTATREVDPVHPVALPLPEAAFADGAVLTSDGEPVTVRTIEIGELYLPSGRVVATDPFTDPKREPFTERVPPGSYPVILSLAQPEGWTTPLTAAARLQFGEGTPVAWHLALTPGQDPGALAEGEFYGFAVDAGSAGLMSAEAAHVHARRVVLLGLPNLPYIMRLSREMEAHVDDGMWAMVEVNRKRGLNAAFLTSGYGDGAYAAYWGYDAEGRAVSLVVDFGVIDEEME